MAGTKISALPAAATIVGTEEIPVVQSGATVKATVTGLGTVLQPINANLTTIAGLTATTDNFIVSVASAWASRTPAQVRTTLGLVIGTNVQAWDADLDTLAGLTATTDNFIVSVASAWASRTPAQVRTTLGLVIGTNVQAYDADLTTWAGITPGTGVGTALAINVGSAGAFVTFNGAGGTPSSLTLTSATGLPISTGVSGLGTGVATALAVNIGSAGAFVAFNGALGTPASGTLTNCTGLPSAGVVTGTSGAAIPLLNGANTFSGLTTFSVGANITPAATPATNAVGYLGAPVNTQDNTYGIVMTDAGKCIYHTSGSAHTWTIPANGTIALPIGTVIVLSNENGGGVVTVAITSDTLRWGSSTGSRSLAANGTATIIKVASAIWRMTGDGIT